MWMLAWGMLSAMAGQASEVHGTVGPQLGLMPLFGAAATVGWDRGHLAAEAGFGVTPLFVSSVYVRGGGTFEVGQGERVELRVQPMAGLRRLATLDWDDGTENDAQVVPTLTVGGELAHWGKDPRTGWFGRLSLGALYSFEAEVPFPEIALAAGLIF